jgi:acyl-CoA synthetase (AMP-forming)/AMP-acid ligase II
VGLDRDRAAATDCHFQAVRAGVIGVPVPGTELKLVPSHGKLEVRVKGPNVFPGYWKQPELTAKAFDDEGFYLIGDAVEFVDPAHPEQRPAVRRPRRRGLQAALRHLGACRQRCAWPASTRCRRSRRTSS